ncbi:MAG: hypothetical protein IT331_04385 [Anaerolineae bacterium]|nr:hypothetical protein [Anaerolineae bacterium]
MKSGLLWYDPKSSYLEDKIQAAAKRYQEKFGIVPNIAFVNPGDLKTGARVKNIKIRSKPTIMPNYIWLGVES